MRKKILISSTTAAAKVLLIIDNLNLNGSLSLIGSSIAETVAIEIPAVETPAVNTDAHWTPLIYDGDAFVLDANTNRRSIPFRGTYRISKPTSSAAFGVGYE